MDLHHFDEMNDRMTMLKKSLLVLIILWQTSFSQTTYDQIRLWSDDTAGLMTILLQAGLDPEAMHVRPGVYIELIVDQDERFYLEANGFMPETVISDVSAYYASRLTQGVSRELGYGSMGGYLTFDEIVESMDSLHAAYPEIVSTKQSIGSSYEGRDIWAFKISDSPNAPDGDPEVLYNSLIHAREPAAMMTLMHFAWELAENYGTDPALSFLVDERQLWFIPVINPDGYVYNELTDPNGGGMHRKNRRPGCSSRPGVDLNRNWGYQWGFDNSGSSPDSCDNTYRGHAPFSEPETQAVRDFVLAHDFQTALNYHSYGDLLIKPYGYDESVALPVPADAIYAQLGPDLVAENGYLFGTGSETVGYIVNGDAVDYMFGELGIINFTPEVGTWANGGFWPPTERIFEMAEANIPMNTHLAGVAGGWIQIEDFKLLHGDGLLSGELVNCELIVMNKGVNSSNTIDVIKLSSPDNTLVPSDSSLVVSQLASMASFDFGGTGLSFEVNASYGEIARLDLSVEMNGYEVQRREYSWIVGPPDTLYFDDFESGSGNWGSFLWGTEMGMDSSLYLTDSPFGYYQANALSSAILNTSLDLRGYNNPLLQFDASWDIEFNYDFCQVLASVDGGSNWTALEGVYTVTGNGVTAQPLGEPGYHGTRTWISESIPLDQFTGEEQLTLSFRLASDAFYEGDGFKVDNLMVLGWPAQAMLGDLNQDGVLNVSDAVLLLETIVSLEPYGDELLDLGDLNHDGTLDVRDLIMLVESILAP